MLWGWGWGWDGDNINPTKWMFIDKNRNLPRYDFLLKKKCDAEDNRIYD